MISYKTEKNNNGTHSNSMESSFLKEKMRKSAEKCGYALLHFYRVGGIGAQENKMRYVMKDLLNPSTEDLEYTCETIYEQANRHLVSAMRYGYTADDLAELRRSINEYRVQVKSKREVATNKKQLEEIMLGFSIRKNVA